MKDKDANWQVFNGQSGMKTTKFTGIIYGGQTENFKKHRRILRRQHQI